MHTCWRVHHVQVRTKYQAGQEAYLHQQGSWCSCVKPLQVSVLQRGGSQAAQCRPGPSGGWPWESRVRGHNTSATVISAAAWCSHCNTACALHSLFCMLAWMQHMLPAAGRPEQRKTPQCKVQQIKVQTVARRATGVCRMSTSELPTHLSLLRLARAAAMISGSKLSDCMALMLRMYSARQGNRDGALIDQIDRWWQGLASRLDTDQGCSLPGTMCRRCMQALHS
jgi:hypothetical protein